MVTTKDPLNVTEEAIEKALTGTPSMAQNKRSRIIRPQYNSPAQSHLDILSPYSRPRDPITHKKPR